MRLLPTAFPAYLSIRHVRSRTFLSIIEFFPSLNHTDNGAPSESWTPDTVIMVAEMRFELIIFISRTLGATFRHYQFCHSTKVTCSTIWANGALLIAIYVLMGNHSTRRLIFMRNLTKTSLDLELKSLGIKKLDFVLIHWIWTNIFEHQADVLTI